VELADRAVGRITPAGVVSEFPLPTAPGALGEPASGGTTSGPDGNVWFTIPGSDKIGMISP